MKEIDLRLKSVPNPLPSRPYNTKYDITREPIIADIIRKVENKEDVFIKFTDGHSKRPGAIAKIRKVVPKESSNDSYRDFPSHYEFTVKWDGRKNTAKIHINDERYIVYLPDYKGETVWEMFDSKQYAKDNAVTLRDRLNQKLEIGDTVVFINARYGYGAELDFGVIRDINYKVNETYHGKYVEPIIIIETIAIKEGDSVRVSKIKQSVKSIIKLTNDDNLLDTALVKKLTVTQKTES